MTGAERCPVCGAEPVARPGGAYVGTVGILWRRRSFEERLYRCPHDHLYSVRLERRRQRVEVTRELQASVEDWVRVRTGHEPLTRPPGL